MNELWTAEFASTAGAFGAGVFVLSDGKVFGGDSGYTYVGTYTKEGEIFNAEVLVEPFLSDYKSIFQTTGQSFNLQISGNMTGNSGFAHGSPREMPNFRLTLKLTRRDV